MTNASHVEIKSRRSNGLSNSFEAMGTETINPKKIRRIRMKAFILSYFAAAHGAPVPEIAQAEEAPQALW